MNKDQIFYATRHEAILNRSHVAEMINKQSKENAEYREETGHYDPPSLKLELASDDDRLTNELCAGFADSYAITMLWPAEDSRDVQEWSAYLDRLITQLNH